MRLALFTGIALVGVPSVLGAVPKGKKTDKDTKINIIHILGDDVGYDDLSCFGSKDIQTPNLDKMASEGIVFTNYCAPHATCTPTRAALLTGRYAPRVNDGAGLDVLWPSTTTGLDSQKEIALPKLLKKAGYSTALVGKWHLGHLPQFLPPAHGFDYFIGIPYPNDHGPERLGNTGSRHLPQIPLVKGDSIIRRVGNWELGELPALFTREACQFIEKQTSKDKPFYLQLSNIETHTPWLVPRGFEGRSKIGPYGDAVAYMDHTVGIIMRYLKKLKIDKNTLVVFSSDNGPLVHPYPELEDCYGKYAKVDPNRYHKYREGKYQARYEGGTRVACIMRWPGRIPAGSSSSELIGGFDLFTTFLNLAGAPLPQDRIIDGRDILPLMLQQPGATSPHKVFFGYTGKGTLQSVRKGKWKLAVPGRNWAVPKLIHPLLFDLSSDPAEQHNIASQHPDIVKELMKLGKAANKAIKKHLPMPLSE